MQCSLLQLCWKISVTAHHLNKPAGLRFGLPFPMQYNDIREVEVVSIGTELNILNAVKRQLNLLFDSSGSFEFNDDDTYLNELITRCREQVEQYTGLSLITKTLRAIIRNECGGVELPYGPVTTISAFKDQDGTALSDITVLGNQFKFIETKSCYLDVTYDAGYTFDKLPAGLLKAVIELVVWCYNHRGEEPNIAICEQSLASAAPYKRTSWIA